jgi:hypothetical protein
MTTSWTLAMGRDDFARTALVYAPMPDFSDGEVRLRVDRVGLSAMMSPTPSSASRFGIGSSSPVARPALRAVRFLRQQCCQL